jgi:hypothetical protein
MKLALCVAIMLALIEAAILMYLVTGCHAENAGAPCDCTVNIDGSIMGTEDGFYYLIEGLSADQADEVQIMINNSLGEKSDCSNN